MPSRWGRWSRWAGLSFLRFWATEVDMKFSPSSISTHIEGYWHANCDRNWCWLRRVRHSCDDRTIANIITYMWMFKATSRWSCQNGQVSGPWICKEKVVGEQDLAFRNIFHTNPLNVPKIQTVVKLLESQGCQTWPFCYFTTCPFYFWHSLNCIP